MNMEFMKVNLDTSWCGVRAGGRLPISFRHFRGYLLNQKNHQIMIGNSINLWQDKEKDKTQK